MFLPSQLPGTVSRHASRFMFVTVSPQPPRGIFIVVMLAHCAIGWLAIYFFKRWASAISRSTRARNHALNRAAGFSSRGAYCASPRIV